MIQVPRNSQLRTCQLSKIQTVWISCSFHIDPKLRLKNVSTWAKPWLFLSDSQLQKVVSSFLKLVLQLNPLQLVLHPHSLILHALDFAQMCETAVRTTTFKKLCKWMACGSLHRWGTSEEEAVAQDLLATEDPESGSLVHFHMLQRPLQGRSSLGVGCLLFVHLKVSNVQHTHCIFFEHTRWHDHKECCTSHHSPPFKKLGSCSYAQDEQLKPRHVIL